MDNLGLTGMPNDWLIVIAKRAYDLELFVDGWFPQTLCKHLLNWTCFKGLRRPG